jgi:hypothetical protein
MDKHRFSAWWITPELPKSEDEKRPGAGILR